MTVSGSSIAIEIDDRSRRRPAEHAERATKNGHPVGVAVVASGCVPRMNAGGRVGHDGLEPSTNGLRIPAEGGFVPLSAGFEGPEEPGRGAFPDTSPIPDDVFPLIEVLAAKLADSAAREDEAETSALLARLLHLVVTDVRR